MAKKRSIRLLGIAPLIVATLLIAAVFVPGLFRGDPSVLPSTREGQPAPEITPIALGSLETFDRGDLLGEGVKIVNFWASWCAPCRVEHPHLKTLAQTIPVYGVNRDQDEDAAQAFLAELGNPFSGVVKDTRNAQSLEWGVYGLPETFVIGADGTVLLHFRGPITQRFLTSDFAPVLEAAGL
ncbi:MAG: DsbE family thiol:disulfide interchange protein [Pseudomonadota bacterium]